MSARPARHAEPPAVTVVLPCQNAAAHLPAALRSVLSQTGVPVFAVVADDGSTDDSVRLAKSFGPRVTVVRSPGRGACAARNAGLAAVETPLVKFLDADDALLPGCLARQAAQLTAFGNGFGGEPASVCGSVLIDGAVTPADPPAEYDAVAMLTAAPLTAAPLHRTVDVRAAGGWDDRVPRGQERDLYLRMHVSGVRFVTRPGVVYEYRRHPGARVSGRDGTPEVAAGRLAANRRQLDLLRATYGDPLPAEIAAAAAEHLWRVGRRSLRCGLPADLAAPFFDLAKSLAPRPAVGGRVYKFAAAVAGPAAAERAAAFARRAA